MDEVGRRRQGGWTARALTVLALVGLAMVAGPPAHAHGDGDLVDQAVSIPGGGSVEFLGDVHYHRLIVRLSGDGPVVLRLVDEAGAVALERGPARAITVNELIACCDDRGWTPYQLVLENPGEDTVTLDIAAHLVHDDLAVMVYGAEPGTRESVAVFAVLWGFIAWRSHHRRRPTTPTVAVTAFGVITLSYAALWSLGALRYGTWEPAALLAGGFDVSLLPVNPLVSGASLSMLLAIIGWLWMASLWIKARFAMRVGTWVPLGVGLVSLVVGAAVAIGASYGAWGMPVALTLVFTTPLLVVMAENLRHRP
ncbi:hypothetical protein [Nocardioides limicola]|uniref:hypothetical protein n=1 Tax=Nocardioides limicola TaxID=2803368 RepID=UPI00193C66C0|nr:hypothetical protein [Nocardioides sp. DJM-14]